MTYDGDILVKFTLSTGRKLKANAVVDCVVKKSIHSLVQTAVIKLPITSRVQKTSATLPSEDTAKIFHEGDRVEVLMGHDGNLVSEFKGFVTHVNFKDPCEVECEGYSYQLSRKAPVKGWKSVKLREVLELLIEGTDIEIHPDTADVELSPFYMGNQGENAIQVLEELRSTKVLISYFINGNQLYVGPEEFAQTGNRVVHNLATNVLNSDDLKYRRKEDVKVHVSITWSDQKGKKHHTSYGEKGGLEISKEFGTLKDADAAKILAARFAETMRYEGYEGKIRTLLVPYCEPGYASVLRDPEYKERQATSIVESIEVHFGANGDERIVEIGKRINRQK